LNSFYRRGGVGGWVGTGDMTGVVRIDHRHIGCPQRFEGSKESMKEGCGFRSVFCKHRSDCNMEVGLRRALSQG
jgi:hypothetical protein